MATRGGPGRGQGRPKGARNKNQMGRIRTIIKQATFSPEEWGQVLADMDAAGFNRFAQYCRVCLKVEDKK